MTCLAPKVKKGSTKRPLVWVTGPACTQMSFSFGVRPKISVTMFPKLANLFLWVRIAPFGFPVVPLE